MTQSKRLEIEKRLITCERHQKVLKTFVSKLEHLLTLQEQKDADPGVDLEKEYLLFQEAIDVSPRR